MKNIFYLLFAACLIATSAHSQQKMDEKKKWDVTNPEGPYKEESNEITEGKIIYEGKYFLNADTFLHNKLFPKFCWPETKNAIYWRKRRLCRNNYHLLKQKE